MKRKAISLMAAFALLVSLMAPALAINANDAVSAIDGGGNHSIALSSTGTVYTWGDNTDYQLGLGAATAKAERPTEVPGLTSVTAVAAGYSYSMALRYNGTVMIWGSGLYQTPTQIDGLQNIVAISAGQLNCLALATDGSVFQWTVGQRPSRVYGVKNAVAVSAGGGFNLALTRNGEVWSWGFNDKGQLGQGNTTENNVPKRISGLQDIVDVAAGTSHALAVDFAGKVYAWGDNNNGQLGKETSELRMSATPVEVSKLSKVVQVAAGNASSLARNDSGQIFAWGHGEYGQTGGNDISKTNPVQVGRGGAATEIACGAYHDLYITRNGEVCTWGRNNYGQLGTGSSGNSSSPSRAMSGVAIGGRYESCVLSGISVWADEEIRAFYPKGLVPPSLLNNYQATITRSELAHLLVSVYESVKRPVSIRDKDKFTDIENNPLKDSILKAHSLGIINGTSETTFNPYGQVTRQEAVTMLCRFVSKMKGTDIPTTAKNISYYADATQVAEWAAPYVDYAYNNNIMKGSNGRFSPMGGFTVEQSLLTVARLAESNGWKA